MNEIVQTAFRSTVEFLRSEIDRLHDGLSASHPSKYVILVYADPVDDSHRKCRFSEYYDNYRHPRDSVSLCRIECSGPIKTPEAIIRAQLYEIT